MYNMKRYADLARQTAAEGAVLLKNEGRILPLKKGCKIAVFGRSQLNYYKSGIGSGGRVNSSYVVSIVDALKKCRDVCLNMEVAEAYEKWVIENPLEKGGEKDELPFCQKEMPLFDDFVRKAAEQSEVAIIIIARISGEGTDNACIPGSFFLNMEEENMLGMIRRYFNKIVVLLNTGNIIDMKWVEKYRIPTVMYVWQGGQEGGNGVLDLLTGVINPCGKLADTIAKNIEDYPSTENFGNPECNVYEEDIYTGYRYFETFAKDRVLYPFGFGLSYTTFDIKTFSIEWKDNEICLQVKVTNEGNVPGKEVIQVYVQAPQGKLGKPLRELCGFVKTKLIQPGDSEVLTIRCSQYYLSSYDDSGVTGYKSSYILEKGVYIIYVGNNVRTARRVGSFFLNRTVLVQKLQAAMAPKTSFRRIRPKRGEEGFRVEYEPVPTREYDLWKKIKENRPEKIEYTGDYGYKLKDVKSNKITLEKFVAQIPISQLCILLRGEGTHSPKVTPGTSAAFGGLSETLHRFGIPIACCADGPSGIRRDDGSEAFCIPNATCIACTFNEALTKELFVMLGKEMRFNRIDVLLGPGMNIHRNPLNGRNFEYFSEDPFLSGKMAAAELKGIHKERAEAAIKHFVCNSQETERLSANMVVSERALRELYLKGFEIVCREGNPQCIMSSYASVNGFCSASNYDLLTSILRNEWGYKGMVMTDWGARGNEEGQPGSPREVAAMVRSQNDIYMVTGDAEKNSNHDNLDESVNSDKLTIGEVQRGALNILRVLTKLPVMDNNEEMI